jgi:L,D-transpeptidase catalytic domain
VARRRMMSGPGRWTVLAVLSLIIGQAQILLTSAPTSAAPAMSGEVQLSNEWTTTTWAYALAPMVIRSQPSTSARPIARVRLETEQGFPEVYELLESHRDAAGRKWVRLRVPGLPNGRTGWVLGAALGSFERTHWLIRVNLHTQRLSVYYKGRLRRRTPVGVGKPSTPTPPGHFWIRERVAFARSSPYWPYALGTSDYASMLTGWVGGDVVAIHGDFGEPRRIPGDPSHGCVRMRDGDIAWLARHVTLGTPVEIVRG